MAGDKKREYERRYYHAHKAERSLANKARYAWLKEHGICVVCAERDAVSGVLCGECRYKRTASRIRSEETRGRGKINARAREKAAERRAAGLCPVCGRPAAEGYKLCEKHVLVGRLNRRKWREEHRIARDPGVCRSRGCSAAVVKGYSYCAEHLPVRQEIMRRNRQKSLENSGHPWRKAAVKNV